VNNAILDHNTVNRLFYNSVIVVYSHILIPRINGGRKD